MPTTCIRRACPKCIKTRIKIYLALLYLVLIGPLLLLTNAYTGYAVHAHQICCTSLSPSITNSGAKRRMLIARHTGSPCNSLVLVSFSLCYIISDILLSNKIELVQFNLESRSLCASDASRSKTDNLGETLHVYDKDHTSALRIKNDKVNVILPVMK